MLLLHILQEGQGEHQPPDADDDDGKLLGDGAAVSQDQQRCDGDHKGDGAAADVAHGVAPGGHLVHPFVGGHVG